MSSPLSDTEIRTIKCALARAWILTETINFDDERFVPMTREQSIDHYEHAIRLLDRLHKN